MSIFNSERCYRPDEIADKLSVDISTVYRLIKDIDDPLPAYRLKNNGQLRVHGQELNAYLNNHKVYPLNTALEVMDNLQELDTKKSDLDTARNYIKALAPWVKEEQIVRNNNDEPIGVSGAHTPFPPFHWRCRTTTEVVMKTGLTLAHRPSLSRSGTSSSESGR